MQLPLGFAGRSAEHQSRGKTPTCASGCPSRPGREHRRPRRSRAGRRFWRAERYRAAASWAKRPQRYQQCREREQREANGEERGRQAETRAQSLDGSPAPRGPSNPHERSRSRLRSDRRRVAELGHEHQKSRRPFQAVGTVRDGLDKSVQRINHATLANTSATRTFFALKAGPMLPANRHRHAQQRPIDQRLRRHEERTEEHDLELEASRSATTPGTRPSPRPGTPRGSLHRAPGASRAAAGSPSTLSTAISVRRSRHQI